MQWKWWKVIKWGDLPTTVADPGKGLTPLNFRPNCGPKCRKIYFWTPGPLPLISLSKGLDDRANPPPHPTVWIRFCHQYRNDHFAKWKCTSYPHFAMWPIEIMLLFLCGPSILIRYGLLDWTDWSVWREWIFLLAILHMLQSPLKSLMK